MIVCLSCPCMSPSQFSVYQSICLSVCVFLFTFIRSPYSFAICWRIELLHAYRPAHSLCPIHCLFHVLLFFFRWHKPVCILRGPGMTYGQQSSCMGHDDFALRKRDFLGLSHDFEAALLTEGAGVFRGAMLRYCAYGLLWVYIFIGPYSLTRRPATCHLTCLPTTQRT